MSVGSVCWDEGHTAYNTICTPEVDLCPTITVSDHPVNDYNGEYHVSSPWFGNAHYKGDNGMHFYRYDGTDGGVPSWSFDAGDQTGSSYLRDRFSGGWIPHNSAAPPLGTSSLVEPSASIMLSCQANVFERVPGTMKCDGDAGGCLGGCHESGTNFYYAETACRRNPQCGAIFDMGCEGATSNSWYLCDKDVPLTDSSDGCSFKLRRFPTTTSTAHTTPFVLQDARTNGCGTPFVEITNAEDCRKAVDELQGARQMPAHTFGGEKSDSAEPRGCFYNIETSEVNFNTHPVGEEHHHTRNICEASHR